MSVVDAPAPNPAGPASPGPGFWLKFLLKRHLRRHLRLGRMNGELDPSQQQAIQFVLDTLEALDELAASVTDYASANGEQPMLAELDATTPPAPTGPQRPIGRFLQWLWNNRQQILQFVLMIVGLFGGPKITLPTGAAQEHFWGDKITQAAVDGESFGVSLDRNARAVRASLRGGSDSEMPAEDVALAYPWCVPGDEIAGQTGKIPDPLDVVYVGKFLGVGVTFPVYDNSPVARQHAILASRDLLDQLRTIRRRALAGFYAR